MNIFQVTYKFVYLCLPGSFTLLLQVHLNMSSPKGVKKKSTTDLFCRFMTQSERNIRNDFTEKKNMVPSIMANFFRAAINISIYLWPYMVMAIGSS